MNNQIKNFIDKVRSIEANYDRSMELTSKAWKKDQHDNIFDINPTITKIYF